MKEPLRDTAFRILLPFTLVIMTFMVQGLLQGPFDSRRVWLIVQNIVFIILTFELGRLAVRAVQKRFPRLSQTRTRLFISFLAAALITFILITVSTLLTRWVTPKPLSFAQESLFNLVQCLWFGVLITAPAEMLYAYQFSFRQELEKNKLEKANLQARMDALQAQLHPHFLFNTMNTLTSLISKDPARAEEFSVEMAHVYRYILKNSNERLITLREELDFVKAYLHLLQVRFQDELMVVENIEKNCLEHKLPPLTLQLLVENAIKHNQASIEKPLEICISTKGNEQVEVSNTLQPKNSAAASSGHGLSSLQQRYQLLGDAPLEVSTTGGRFTVLVTLFQQYGKEDIRD